MSWAEFTTNGAPVDHATQPPVPDPVYLTPEGWATNANGDLGAATIDQYGNIMLTESGVYLVTAVVVVGFRLDNSPATGYAGGDQLVDLAGYIFESPGIGV